MLKTIKNRAIFRKKPSKLAKKSQKPLKNQLFSLILIPNFTPRPSGNACKPAIVVFLLSRANRQCRKLKNG
jgi:hypothetical protein